MTPINILYHCISSIFQHFIITSLCLYLLQTSKKQATRPAAILSFFICWIPIIAIQLNNNNWVLLSSLFFVIIYTVLTNIITCCGMIRGALSFCFSYFLIMLTDLPCIFLSLLIFSPETIVNDGRVSLFVAICGVPILYAIIRLLPVKKFFRWLCNIPTILGYFFLLILVFLSILCDLYSDLTYISPALPSILIMLLVFSSTLLLVYQIFSNQRNAQALHYYEQYLPILENLIQKVRTVQHGHNNMVQSLVHLSELDLKNEDLQSQLRSYTQNIQKAILPSSFLQLENRLLAALLYYKYCQAEDAGISMEFRILNPLCQSKANEFELVDAAGILIDNALESCHPGDTIYITLDAQKNKKNQQIYLKVENPGPLADETFLHRIFSKGYTTKKTDSTEHGIGLNVLKNMTDKYHGSLIVSNTEKNKLQFLVFELIL